MHSQSTYSLASFINVDQLNRSTNLECCTDAQFLLRVAHLLFIVDTKQIWTARFASERTVSGLACSTVSCFHRETLPYLRATLSPKLLSRSQEESYDITLLVKACSKYLSVFSHLLDNFMIRQTDSGHNRVGTVITIHCIARKKVVDRLPVAMRSQTTLITTDQIHIYTQRIREARFFIMLTPCPRVLSSWMVRARFRTGETSSLALQLNHSTAEAAIHDTKLEYWRNFLYLGLLKLCVHLVSALESVLKFSNGGRVEKC